MLTPRQCGGSKYPIAERYAALHIAGTPLSGGPVVRFPFGLMQDGKVNYLSGGDGGEVTLLGIVSEGIQQNMKSTFSFPSVVRIEAHTQIAGVGAMGIIGPASKVSKPLTMAQQGKAKMPVCDLQITNTGVGNVSPGKNAPLLRLDPAGRRLRVRCITSGRRNRISAKKKET